MCLLNKNNNVLNCRYEELLMSDIEFYYDIQFKINFFVESYYTITYIPIT